MPPSSSYPQSGIGHVTALAVVDFAAGDLSRLLGEPLDNAPPLKLASGEAVVEVKTKADNAAVATITIAAAGAAIALRATVFTAIEAAAHCKDLRDHLIAPSPR